MIKTEEVYLEALKLAIDFIIRHNSCQTDMSTEELRKHLLNKFVDEAAWKLS